MRFNFCVIMTLINIVLATSQAYAQKKPNILLIVADDLGQWALGSYGLKQMGTPNLDWLAQNGVQFENAMSPAPVCSPARASLNTGKTPSQHGVHDFLSEEKEFDANWLKGEKLLSEYLREYGYKTALLGKWHATTDSAVPQRGFDRWVSYDTSREGWENQYLHKGKVNFSVDGTPFQYTGTQARFLTQEAIKFIDEAGEKPFFISLNFVEPHAPLEDLPERLVSKYRPVAHKIIRAGGSSDLPHRLDWALVPNNHEEQLAQYLAAVSLLDDQVGHLLDAISGRGLEDNTVLIFVSDHGLLVGQYGLYGKTNTTNPANFYEETIRIPMIFYAGKKLLRPKQLRSEMVDLIDIHTTILDFASLGQRSSSNEGPGSSLRPLLSGERPTDWRKYNYAERGNIRMITNGHWKLVRIYPYDEEARPMDHWYDLTSPLRERVSTKPPREALKNELISALNAHFSRFENKEKTGRRIWDQPFPNGRAKNEILNDHQRYGGTSDQP